MSLRPKPCYIPSTGERCKVSNEKCPLMFLAKPDALELMLAGVTRVALNTTRSNPPEVLRRKPRVLEDDVRLEFALTPIIRRAAEEIVDIVPALAEICATDFVAFDDEPIQIGDIQYAEAVRRAT